MQNDLLEYHKKNLRILKNYVDDPNSDDGLKIKILGWMWDNLKIINSSNPKQRNNKYAEEVLAFLTLIESK